MSRITSEILKLFYRACTKTRFCSQVSLDRDSTFEGHNFIGKGTTIYSTALGLGSYVASGSHLSRTRIGRFCAIGRDVRTHLGRHPSSDFVSINPSFYSSWPPTGLRIPCGQLFEEHLYVDNKKRFVVAVGNDVWIGDRVSILDGITIGDGSIIGLGSVVTKDVEPYSINVGSPAKKIKMRFSDQQIEYLKKFLWWERDLAWLNKNKELFADINKLMNAYPI